MKKVNNDYVSPQVDVVEVRCDQCVLTGSFALKELQEDNSDNDFFNF